MTKRLLRHTTKGKKYITWKGKKSVKSYIEYIDGNLYEMLYKQILNNCGVALISYVLNNQNINK